MKVSEFNQTMAYLLRPQPRQTLAIGGGVIEGQDLGSREGFATPREKRAILKSKIDDLVLQGTTQISRKDLMTLVEESGLAGSDVRKQLNKLEKNHPDIFSKIKILSVQDLSGSKDFEKFLNEKLKTLKGPIETTVPNLVAESGVEIDTPTADSVIRKNKNFSKNFVLSFGKKLDPVVEKNLTKAINAYKRLPKKTKFAFQTGGMGQEGKLEKFLKQFDLRSDTVGKKLFRNKLQSLDLYEKAPILGPNQQKIMEGRKSAIGSAKAYEDHLYKFKKEVQESLGLPKTKTKTGREFLPIDMAHRTDIYQLEQLGEKLKVEDYGPEYEIINRQKVKSLENKLTPLYETQSKLFNEAKNSKTISSSLKEKIIKNNNEILETVGTSDLKGRIKPITVDPNTLKIKRGQNVLMELGIGLVDSDMDKIVYPTKKNNFTSSLDDLTIKANLAEQTLKEAIDAGLIDEATGRQRLNKFLNVKDPRIEELLKIEGVTTADKVSVPEKSRTRKMFEDFSERYKTSKPIIQKFSSKVPGSAAVLAPYDLSMMLASGAPLADALASAGSYFTKDPFLGRAVNVPLAIREMTSYGDVDEMLQRAAARRKGIESILQSIPSRFRSYIDKNRGIDDETEEFVP